MKKHIKIQCLVALCALSLASCTDVIDVDLNTTDPKFVIEGNVTDQVGRQVVTVRKTVNFDEPNNYPAVTGARVTISDGSSTDTLAETAPGRYETVNILQGEVGKTYFLRVEAEGKVFEATSTMPQKVSFDSLYQSNLSVPGRATTVLVPVYRDPAGLGDHYRFVAWRNGGQLTDFNVRDDRNNDGLSMTQPIFLPSEDLETGDSMTVEMQTIDRTVYKYFVALGGSGGGPNNESVPANPDTNLSNGALGYFSAHTLQRRQMVIR